MALIVEDGTGLTNSNSYVDVAGLRDFAGQRGYTVPAGDLACEQLLIKAMDYLEGIQYYIGTRASTTQALSWPRKDAITREGIEIASNFIPQSLKNAQCQLAFDSQTITLIPSMSAGAKGAVMSESVYGAVSRTYNQPSSSTALTPYLGAAKNFLKELVRGYGMTSTVAIRT